MSGLFTRLAAQALGGGVPRARSAAALPFAPAPALAPVLTDAPGLVELAAGPAPETAAETAAETGARPVPEPLVAMPGPARTQAGEPEAATEAEPAAERIADATPRQPDGTPRQPDAPREAGRSAPVTLHEVVARLVAAPAARAPVPASPPRERGAQPPAPPLPHVLLPEVGEATPPAQAPRGAARHGAAPQPAPTPEIHVHIGRIEVTSATEPAPRPAPRAPKRQPMSLAQYLDKRRGS